MMKPSLRTEQWVSGLIVQTNSGISVLTVMWTVTERWLTNHIGDSSVSNFFFISDCIVPRLFSDIMSADRQLANEIEFDLRKFEEQQEELERQRLEQLRRRSRGVPVRTLFLFVALNLMSFTSYKFHCPPNDWSVLTALLWFSAW